MDAELDVRTEERRIAVRKEADGGPGSVKKDQ